MPTRACKLGCGNFFVFNRPTKRSSTWSLALCIDNHSTLSTEWGNVLLFVCLLIQTYFLVQVCTMLGEFRNIVGVFLTTTYDITSKTSTADQRVECSYKRNFFRSNPKLLHKSWSTSASESRPCFNFKPQPNSCISILTKLQLQNLVRTLCSKSEQKLSFKNFKLQPWLLDLTSVSKSLPNGCQHYSQHQHQRH